MTLWFVTGYNPRYRRAEGDLATLPLNGVRQSLRRHFQKLEPQWGKCLVFGGIEVSLETDQAGNSVWGPHWHFVIATNCPEAALREFLRPSGPMEPNAKPLVIKEVWHLANCLAYCVKRTPAERVAYTGARGTKDLDKRSVTGAAALEHDRWLLGQKPTDRLILRGFKRVHGKLVRTA